MSYYHLELVFKCDLKRNGGLGVERQWEGGVLEWIDRRGLELRGLKIIH